MHEIPFPVGEPSVDVAIIVGREIANIKLHVGCIHASISDPD